MYWELTISCWSRLSGYFLIKLCSLWTMTIGCSALSYSFYSLFIDNQTYVNISSRVLILCIKMWSKELDFHFICNQLVSILSCFIYTQKLALLCYGHEHQRSETWNQIILALFEWFWKELKQIKHVAYRLYSCSSLVLLIGTAGLCGV